ncbi:MAG: type I glyceraldehyde-3-phosphate dehydrogenase [Chloroflexi bacterium]|nr:type I glyceraldehyde-3-phosphate dehydrogenase [Chloroflexota bacterium]
MTIKVGVNGFGRIGRQVVKIMKMHYDNDFDIVAFNDLGNLETMAHLFKYDTVYGSYKGSVEVTDSGLVIDGDEIKALSERDPAQLGWGDLGVDLVIESTGLFRSRDDAAKHLEAGAKKVIISAPGKNPDLTVVLGVNEDDYKADEHDVVSNASCTTNALAPVAKVLQDAFGINRGVLNTIHSITSTQNLVDGPHKDLRRARSAYENIIPTSTGAAKAVGLVLPELEGRFDGFALRVPTPTVSVVDFVALLEQDVTTDALHEAFTTAANGPMEGILKVNTEPLVSSDLIGSMHSSIVDAEFTFAVGGEGPMVKVVAWYDNEWGYSVRTVDLAKFMGDKL